MNTLIRTTVAFQPSLLQRLKIFAEKRGKTVTEIVEASTREYIEKQEQPQIDQLYQGLFELAGMCKEPVENASTSIDDLLYGDNGAWKGENE